MATLYSIGSFLRKSATVFLSSSVMPITTRPWDWYFLLISLRCGMVARHGGHHVAQNSTIWGLPLVSGSLSTKSTRSGGGSLPTPSFWAAWGEGVTSKNVAAVREFGNFIGAFWGGSRQWLWRKKRTHRL